MSEHLIDIKVAQPGRITGQYYSADSESFRLEKIIYPEEPLPFDVCILPTALTSFGEPVPGITLGSLSHPFDTEMEARLLGAVQRGEENPVLLAVPSVDGHCPHRMDDLSEGQRIEITRVLNDSKPGSWQWLTVEEVEPYLHEAATRYQKSQADGKILKLDPAWKPLNIGHPEASFAEAERYTAAEYTFYDLPHHFQHYVNEYLAPDERILYAVRRPAMPSHLKRSLLHREQLQAGVLILTNQRLIQLSELIPPDSANIRYGFHTMVGVLERLSRSSLKAVGGSLILCSEWRSNEGAIAAEWEVPEHAHTMLEELSAFLRRFEVDADDCALRCMTPPELPEKLPALVDTASNDPKTMTLLNEQFSAALAEALSSGERVHAWALLPEWFERKKGAQALVVTDRRIFLLPGRSFTVPLSNIATLEYTSSILESSIAANYVQKGVQHRKIINFPYPAQESFRECFEAARRCMAVIPAV